MIIVLSREDVDICREFSEKCAKNQQEIEFGQRDTARRSINEIARDNLIGKLAEVAFAKMLNQSCGIIIDLDFNYYPRGVWDGQDILVNKWRIDIKGTRPGSEWLLVEWSKLGFRKKENKLPHVFVMAETGWDRSSDEPTGDVKLIGYCYLGELNYGVSGTYVLRKNKILPGKNVRLQADNYGRPFRVLKRDWGNLMKSIMIENPPVISDYAVPKSY